MLLHLTGRDDRSHTQIVSNLGKMMLLQLGLWITPVCEGPTLSQPSEDGESMPNRSYGAECESLFMSQ